eukprot:9484179-Pyramimonas_sp.AAC.1
MGVVHHIDDLDVLHLLEDPVDERNTVQPHGQVRPTATRHGPAMRHALAQDKPIVAQVLRHRV